MKQCKVFISIYRHLISEVGQNISSFRLSQWRDRDPEQI